MTAKPENVRDRNPANPRWLKSPPASLPQNVKLGFAVNHRALLTLRSSTKRSRPSAVGDSALLLYDRSFGFIRRIGIDCKSTIYIIAVNFTLKNLRESTKKPNFATQNANGAIAQLVEQRTENPCVTGSIPVGTTENQRVTSTVTLFFYSLTALRQPTEADG